jgi:hypothetical protein
MVRSEGNMSLKNPVTPSGIDPGTVRLVAQRLNHYATPYITCGSTKYRTDSPRILMQTCVKIQTRVAPCCTQDLY